MGEIKYEVRSTGAFKVGIGLKIKIKKDRGYPVF